MENSEPFTSPKYHRLSWTSSVICPQSLNEKCRCIVALYVASSLYVASNHSNGALSNKLEQLFALSSTSVKSHSTTSITMDTHTYSASHLVAPVAPESDPAPPTGQAVTNFELYMPTEAVEITTDVSAWSAAIQTAPKTSTTPTPPTMTTIRSKRGR